MSVTKKYYLWFILLLVALFWVYTYVTRPQPCTVPITYFLGTFDNRFGITKAQFQSDIEAATHIWDNAINKKLFVYDPKHAEIAFNLIYDSRQENYLKSKTLESQVNSTIQSADVIKEQFNALKQSYAQKSAEYQTLLAQLKQEQDSYNTEVEYWNKRGGAPKTEYEKLTAEKNDLATLSATVETKRQEVNSLAEQVNNLIGKYNYLVKDANSAIGVINQNADKEFQEGEYISDTKGERINVYEFDTEQSLIRVLEHELGHALGLDHNDNPQSIMYYLNQSPNNKLTSEDRAALMTVCHLK